MRKIIFLFSTFLLYLFLGLWINKEAFALGTCYCSVSPSSRLEYVSVDNCDKNTEYASGCTGTSNSLTQCVCKPKAVAGPDANTCTCNGSGVILTNNCQVGTMIPTCNTRESVLCRCTATGSFGPNPPNPDNASSCTTANGKGVETALGCIPTEINQFAPWLLQFIFGIAGGIAFLLMVYGFILMATSSGDEKKVQAAKETITSAITGLLVSIFALFIFRLIAVNILRIPGIN